jgi:ribosomal protein L16 Arg81 hydroxylase
VARAEADETPHGAPAPLSFAALLAPVDVATFLESHWEERPLHVARGDASYYERAIPTEAAIALVENLEPLGRAVDPRSPNRRNHLDVLGGSHDGERQTRPARPDDVRAAIAAGRTIRVNDVHHRMRAIESVCAMLHGVFSSIVGANLYYARAGAGGTGLHVDPHDVYVLQLRGKKRWRLREGTHKYPLRSTPTLSFDAGTASRKPRSFSSRDLSNAGELVLDCVLEQGDLLYVPRGTYHEVAAVDADTLHVTIGTWPIAWVDLLTVALADVAARDPRLRRAVPVGALRAQLAAGVDGAEAAWRDAFADVARTFLDGADARGALESLATATAQVTPTGLRRERSPGRAADIADDARFERVPSVDAAVDGAGARLRVSIRDAGGARVLDLPARCRRTIEHALSGASFTVDELPRDLEQRSRAQLVDRLAHAGVIRRVT